MCRAVNTRGEGLPNVADFSDELSLIQVLSEDNASLLRFHLDTKALDFL
jgi:hypothetical protein